MRAGLGREMGRCHLSPGLPSTSPALVFDFDSILIGTAEYEQKFLEPPQEERQGMPGGGEGEASGDDNDPLFNDAVRLVIEFGKASTSLLQRRLRIGYGRAAHLIDLMERDGIVGAADGPKPREVLKRPSWISEVEESMR